MTLQPHIVAVRLRRRPLSRQICALAVGRLVLRRDQSQRQGPSKQNKTLAQMCYDTGSLLKFNAAILYS
jgi:hypothetical protein